LTRADLCSADRKRQILGEITGAWGRASAVEAAFVPNGFVNACGERKDAIADGAAVAAFCGIGNPEGFRRTLSASGTECGPAAFHEFPDHFLYSPADLERLGDWARTCRADILLTTQKDLVKIPRTDLHGIPLWALAVRAQITTGQDSFERQLERLTTRSRAKAASNPNP